MGAPPQESGEHTQKMTQKFAPVRPALPKGQRENKGAIVQGRRAQRDSGAGGLPRGQLAERLGAGAPELWLGGGGAGGGTEARRPQGPGHVGP